jgi:hypothetical protein
MLATHIDTSALTRRIQEFATVAKKDFGTVLRQEAGIITGLLIESSPPGDKTVEGFSKAARTQGEERVEGDIRKLFPTSRAGIGTLKKWAAEGQRLQVGSYSQKVRVWNVATTEAELKRLHKMSRRPSAGGRTWVRGNRNVAVTRVRILNRYVKSQKLKVGTLTAGFMPAATEFKTTKKKQPAWVRRHASKAKGVGKEVRDAHGMALRIENNQGYFEPATARRMERIAKRRENGLAKAVDSMIARKAKRKRMGLI